MKIGIIGAMEEELRLLKKSINVSTENTIAGKQFSTGSLGMHHEVVILRCGVGKVNAAIGTTLLNYKFKPDYVFNIGSIGACLPSFSIGDIVISTAVRYYDVDLTAFGYEFGQASKMPATFEPDNMLINLAEECGKKFPQLHLKKALIVSGDTFLTTCEKVNFIKEQFSEICAAEMEACAVAHTCYLFNIPFIIVRSVSDIIGVNAQVIHEKSLDLASENVAHIVLEMLKNLLKIKLLD